MSDHRQLRSDMGWSTPDKIVVRGFDLTKDLIGKIDLGAMAFLEITGRLPNAREADVFNALLITLVEHGVTPHAIAARVVHTAACSASGAAVCTMRAAIACGVT